MSKSSDATDISLSCDGVTIQLKLPGHGKIIEQSKRSLIDVDAVVRQALDAPEAYPPIRHAVVVGDRIILACSAIVPELEKLLAIVASYFIETGIDAENLTLLLAERCAFDRESFDEALGVCLKERTFRTSTPDKLSSEISVVQGPFEREELAYLAADADAYPLYIHRLLVDADFALCIAQFANVNDVQQASVGGMVPWFCDKDTRKRWNAEAILDLENGTQSGQYAQDVQWLLGPGVSMTVGNLWNQDASETSVQANTNVNAKKFDNAEQLRLTTESNIDVVVGALPLASSWSAFAATLASLVDNLSVARGRIVVACKQLPVPTPAFKILREFYSDDEKIFDALAKSDDPFASDIAYIASIMLNHSIFTLEHKPREKVALPWESIGSSEECASLLRTAECPVVVL